MFAEIEHADEIDEMYTRYLVYDMAERLKKKGPEYACVQKIQTTRVLMERMESTTLDHLLLYLVRIRDYPDILPQLEHPKIPIRVNWKEGSLVYGTHTSAHICCYEHGWMTDHFRIGREHLVLLVAYAEIRGEELQAMTNVARVVVFAPTD